MNNPYAPPTTASREEQAFDQIQRSIKRLTVIVEIAIFVAVVHTVVMLAVIMNG